MSENYTNKIFDINPESFSFIIVESEIKQRLDRVLNNRRGVLSRSRYKELIKQGQVTINGKIILEPDYKVKLNDIINIEIPVPVKAEPKAEKIPLNVIYEDNDLIVVNKPPGLVVHPAAGNWQGTMVNALIYHCGSSLSGIGGVLRPGIVHRLDKDTSGLMVVAKNDIAHRGLSEQFSAHGRDGKLVRSYIALVWGLPSPSNGIIGTNIGRKNDNRQKMSVLKTGGRHAITHYSIKEKFTNKGKLITSLVKCNLETGRTHQIRVHMAYIGHPLLGDKIYGSGFNSSVKLISDECRYALEQLNRQALHAETLGFQHPTSGEKMHFSSNPPKDFQLLLDNFRNGYN